MYWYGSEWVWCDRRRSKRSNFDLTARGLASLDWVLPESFPAEATKKVDLSIWLPLSYRETEKIFNNRKIYRGPRLYRWLFHALNQGYMEPTACDAYMHFSTGQPYWWQTTADHTAII